MIGYIEGILFKLYEDRILLLVNQVGYEILLPASTLGTMNDNAIGQKLSFYIYYHQTERQPRPVLIGFRLEEEKDFFQQFITVEDIGPLKAMKALTMPIHEIALAIEQKEAKKLEQLKGVGTRTAMKIIATLSGKMERFVANAENPKPNLKANPDFMKDVFSVLVEKLGHKPADAKKMIDSAIKKNENISTPEQLFDEIYKG